MKRWAEIADGIGAAALWLLPPAGLGWFVARRYGRRRRDRHGPPTQSRFADLLLVAAFGLLAIAAAIHGGDALVFAVGFGALVLASGRVVRLRRPAALYGLSGTLVLVGVLATAGALKAATGLGATPYDQSIRSLLDGRAHRLDGQGARAWRATDRQGPMILSFDLRLLSGDPAAGWDANAGRFEQAPVASPFGPAIRVVHPTGGNPYLSRTAQLNEPIAGRTFRLELPLRLVSGTPVDDGVAISAPGLGKHVLDLESDWKAHRVEWTVPSSVDTTDMRVVLERFYGLTYEVGRPTLYERVDGAWTVRDPPVGGIPSVSVRTPAGVIAHARVWPSAEWTRHTVAVRDPDLEVGDAIDVRWRSGDLLTVALRNVSLRSQDAQAKDPTPRLRFVRQRLWLPHPNLFGHGMAALALAVLALARSLPFALLVWPVSLVFVATTGSRTALAALLLGGALSLLVLAWRKRRRVLVSGVVVAVAAVVVGVAAGSGDALRLAVGVNATSRLEIWTVALEALRSNPWTGIGPGAFAEHYATVTGVQSVTNPAHAHNLWLDWAASYGALGAASAVGLSAAFLLLGYRARRMRGIVFVLGVLLMQSLDTTLPSSAVLFPCMVVFGTRDAPKRPHGDT